MSKLSDNWFMMSRGGGEEVMWRLGPQHQLLTAVSFHQRSVLLQLYNSSQEDTEVRIAAYQQLMLCPDQEVFEVVKTRLRSETSSQGLIKTLLSNVFHLLKRSVGTTKDAIFVDKIMKREYLHDNKFIMQYFLNSRHDLTAIRLLISLEVKLNPQC